MLLTPAAARAGSLGSAHVLASPTFPGAVAAAGGVIAWAAPSGGARRFEIVIHHGAATHALSDTSAVGWIDAVKLGTDSHGHAIVVYSRCPHSPFATANAGSAGSDGCLLWWAPLSGGCPRRIAAAPLDSTVGAATAGSVVFAVQPNTAHPNQPARIARSTLAGRTAVPLHVPSPAGSTISDIAVSAQEVAFIEQPRVANPMMGASQVWLDAPGSPTRLLAQQISDTVPIDDSARFFDGLALTGSDAYAFLYANSGIYPPVASQLEQIPLLTNAAITMAPWAPGPSLSSFGIQATAFDPSHDRLVLGLFSPAVDLSTSSGACSGHATSRRACPIVTSSPVSFP